MFLRDILLINDTIKIHRNKDRFGGFVNIFSYISYLFHKGINVEPSLEAINNKIQVKETQKKGAQRIRNIYDPLSQKPYKLSRSKLELFMRCKRCFYIDRRLGVGHPDGYSFSLNLAVDELLKKEFDIYRLEQKFHPLCLENNVNAVPFNHKNLESWRKSLHEGVQYHVPNTNLLIHGGLDDVWINPDTDELFVVDYKATSKNGGITLDADWQISYKRQAEIYQWLLRRNGFTVSNTAYFVYCNGKKDLPRFDKKLDFDVFLLPYEGNDLWVEETIREAYGCLQGRIIPALEESCDYCRYYEGVKNSLERILS